MSHTIDADDLLFIDVIDRERRRRRRPPAGGTLPGLLSKFVFGVAADRVTMLHAANMDGAPSSPPAGTNFGISSDKPANFVNQWTRGGSAANGNNFVTLGVFVIAPDGTSTAQKIVEANTNQAHSMVAGVWENANNAIGGYNINWIDLATKYRLSVFAKAAERSRMALAITDSAYNSVTAFPGTNGTQAVFDLGSGTVAVANTALSGSPSFTPITASITAYPNGWFRCDLDTIVGPFYSILNPSTAAVILANVFIDAGTGNAPALTSYQGNGTSGILVWRSCMLPVAAFALNNQVLFDDFLSTSTIDVNNSRQPGFTWYVDNLHMFGGLAVPTPLRFGLDYDLTNSFINFHVGNDNPLVTWFTSTVSDGTKAGFLGNAFRLPALFEARGFIDPAPGADNVNAQPIFWTDAAEGIYADTSNNWPTVPEIEIDFVEWGLGSPPNSTDPGFTIHQFNVPPPPFPANEAGHLTGFHAWPTNITPNFTVPHTWGCLAFTQATGTPPFGPGQRNIMPNTTWSGGVVGSPGTLPSRMQFVTNGSPGLPPGLSQQVVAVSSTLFQLRISGTVGAGSFITTFEMNSGPHNSSNGTIAPGQIWTGSVSLRVAAGSDATPGGATLIIRQYNAADTDLGITDSKSGVTVNLVPLTRWSTTLAISSLNVARLGLAIQWGFGTGNVIDMTYEFSQPQLELSFMPTTFQAAGGSDVQGVLGTSVIAGEPFFKRTLLFFDGGFVNELAVSNWTGLTTGSPLFTGGDNLHYPVILGASNNVWPSHWDFCRVVTQ